MTSEGLLNAVKTRFVQTQEVHNARVQITHEKLANKAVASLVGTRHMFLTAT